MNHENYPIHLLLWICALFSPLIVNAQSEPMQPRTSAYRIFQNIKVDGNLDEPPWQNAQPINRLFQIQPNQGEPMTQATEVRILYDDKKLYLGFTCFDSEIEKLVANEMRRDSRRVAFQRLRFSAFRYLQRSAKRRFLPFQPIGRYGRHGGVKQRR